MKKGHDKKMSGKQERLLEGREDVALYTIGVASRLLNCEPSVLRRYEKAGFIEPERSEGNTRFYSENQLEKLREIRELIEDERVNMAGTAMIIEMRKLIENLNKEISSLKEEVSLLKGRLGKGVDGAEPSLSFRFTK